MLRRLAALAVVTAGATFTGTAAAALEGTPSTVIPDGPGASQAHVVAGDQGNALVLTASAAGTAWRPSLDLPTATWGALIPNGRPGSPVAAARMGSMAALLTSDGTDLTLNRLTIGGLVMAGSHVLNRADHTADGASLVASGGTSALAVYAERPQGGGITEDLRANQLTEIRGNTVQVPQTVAADIAIEGTPAVAAAPDGAAIIGYAVREGVNDLRAKVVWRTSRFGQWSAPGDLGPIGSSTPQVAAGDDGRLAIIWAGTDGRVRMRTASAAQGFSPTALVSGARINPIPVVSLGTDGSALALWYAGAVGNQRAEAVRVGAGASIEPPRDLGPSGVDSPAEQHVVPTPGGGFAAAWNSPHGPDGPAADFGVVVARTHGAAWWTSAVDGVGDAHMEYRPRIAALPGGDVLATWRRTPMAGPGANEVRAQVISAHLPIPPMEGGAGAPPIGAPAPPAPPAAAAPPAPAPTAPVTGAAPAATAPATAAGANRRPARLAVRWTRSGRTLRATIVRRGDSTGYRMTARKGGSTRKARCIAKRVKVTRTRGTVRRTVRVRRQVCTVRLGRGTWRVTAVARKGPAVTATASRTHRVR